MGLQRALGRAVTREVGQPLRSRSGFCCVLLLLPEVPTVVMTPCYAGTVIGERQHAQ